jgi:hypothetical protein
MGFLWMRIVAMAGHESSKLRDFIAIADPKEDPRGD